MKQRILKELNLVSSEIKSLEIEKKRLQRELKLIKAKEEYTESKLSKEELISHVLDLFVNYNKPKLVSIQGVKFFCNAGDLKHEEDNILLKMVWNGVKQPIIIIGDVPHKIKVKHNEKYILCEIHNALLMTQHGSVFENDI